MGRTPRNRRRARRPGLVACEADLLAHTDSSMRTDGYGGWGAFPAGSSDLVAIYYWPSARASTRSGSLKCPSPMGCSRRPEHAGSPGGSATAPRAQPGYRPGGCG